MIKRFSNLRKVLRLSLFLTLYFGMYFFVLKVLYSEPELNDDLSEDLNSFDLVFYDTTPVRFDKDDGEYVGQVINYRTAPEYTSFGSVGAVKEDTVCLFTQFSAVNDAYLLSRTDWMLLLNWLLHGTLICLLHYM
jgi:hypothetical protein